MKIKTLYVFIIIGAFIFTNCKKPKGNEYCIYESKTTAMMLYPYPKSNDSIYYTQLQLTLKFDVKYIESWPPCGSFGDSVVGKITQLDVITNYLINNDTIKDTINQLITAKITYYNMDSLNFKLNETSVKQPNCHHRIILQFDSATKHQCLQYLEINYKEDNGACYSAITNPFYINK